MHTPIHLAIPPQACAGDYPLTLQTIAGQTKAPSNSPSEAKISSEINRGVPAKAEKH